MGLRKSKERALKDINDKLKARPVILNSTGAGLKLTSRHQSKDLKSLKRARELLIMDELFEPMED